MNSIGQPINRRDGHAKVTGAARYTADIPARHCAHAVLACATIPAGELVTINTAAAERAPGVIKVFTHQNLPKFSLPLETPPAGQKNLPLQDSRIDYEGQPIALIVAETLEEATHAAKLVTASYRVLPFETDFRKHLDQSVEAQGYFPNDSKTGDVTAALAHAAVKIEQTYRTADRHHNPMEPSATLAEWRDGQLFQHDATQGVQANRLALAKAFGLDPKKVHVKNEYVGGGFGCKGWLWPHQALCAMAAREVRRPVKLVLPRAQTYTSHGYQPATEQAIALGANRDGTLIAVRHTSANPTPLREDYVETCATASRPLYASPNLETQSRVVRVARSNPTPMRAPHEGPGLVALEIAMDELAYRLEIDPLALRLKNYAQKDPTDGRPFAAKKLRECYEEGARRFGWSRRTMAPRSMSEGRDLIGWGMASAIMQTFRQPAKARASVDRNGNVIIEGSTQEIGTGTITVMSQIAAEVLGVPVERVQLKWGDVDLPAAPMTAGSTSTLSFGSAVHDAATKLKAKLALLAKTPEPDPARFGELVRASGGSSISAEGEWGPSSDSDPTGQPKDAALNSYGVLFVEVRIDRDFMIPRVTRGVGVFNAGRIINPKTARSQLTGGFAWGVGQALLESSEMDHRLGRYLSKNLAGYLVPVNADIPELDMSFIEEPDFKTSPIGARGIGELSATGVGPAIANAVYHATGIRVREVPIRPEMLLR